MDTSRTLSRRPLRRFWGWGLAADTLAEREQATVKAMLFLKICDNCGREVGSVYEEVQ